MKKLLILHLVFLHVPLFSTQTFISTFLRHCNNPNARKILIASYDSYNELHHPKLLDTIIAARKRGTIIQIVTPKILSINNDLNATCQGVTYIDRKFKNLIENRMTCRNFYQKFLPLLSLHGPGMHCCAIMHKSRCCVVYENQKKSILLSENVNGRCTTTHDHSKIDQLTQQFDDCATFILKYINK